MWGRGTYHSRTRRFNLEYWLFESFDEARKDAEGAVGAKWGMWITARTALPLAIITNLARGDPSR
jgi:hypothetical protein